MLHLPFPFHFFNSSQTFLLNFILLYYFFRYCVPESPRWLLARGRLDELVALIERAAKMNGRTLPLNYQKSLEAETGTIVQKDVAIATEAIKVGISESPAAAVAAGDNNQLSSTGIIDCNASPLYVVFSKHYWRTTCLTLIVWLTLIIIYFGLTLHLSNLGGNIYLNTVRKLFIYIMSYSGQSEKKIVIDFLKLVQKEKERSNTYSIYCSTKI